MKTTERVLDVSKGSLIRLLNDAYKRSAGTKDTEHYALAYWDGYTRALETVLEMEHE